MKKIVINARPGGFALSREAAEILIERGHDLTIDDEPKRLKGPITYTVIGEEKIPRDHPDLVEVVERLGDAASGPIARLRIVEIPDDAVTWRVEDLGIGEERVAEGRIWYAKDARW